MGTGIFFPLCAIPFSIIIMILLLFKIKIKNDETLVYKILVVSNFVGLIIEILCSYACYIYYDYTAISEIILKSYLIYLLFWTALFTYYTYIISTEKSHRKKIFELLVYLSIIVFSIVIYYLPIEVVIENNFQVHYTTGACVLFSYGASGIYILGILYLIIKNLKNIINKKYLPLFLFFVIGTASIVTQLIFPQILLLTYVETLICVVMYFTLENPDVKMLEEFRIAKDMAEKANEEKELFLYNITQDIRNPLNEITKASNWLNENTRNKNVTDATYYINKNASNITDLVNNVLDISTLELTNIKVYNTSYNINNINKFIEKTYKEKMNEKVEFRMNVDSNIPTALYGDQIRLKQAIQIIIENAIKYTKTGFIDYTVNCIEKNKLCRLLISVEDSGLGIKPSEMEQILNKEERLIKNDKIDDNIKNIAMAKSIVNLLGGTLLIDSEIGSGTKMTIVLDQKIYDEKSIELNKIEKDVNKFIDNTKVLLVVEDEEYREKVVKKLSKFELDLEVVELGSKCLDNIRMSKKYDLIIMDESLSHLSSIEIINKLKEIPSFNIPVALLTVNTDNKGYIDNGFSYLLDKKISSKELESIIEKIERSSK